MGETQLETGKPTEAFFLVSPKTMEDAHQVVQEIPAPSKSVQADILYDPDEIGLSVVERLLVLVPDQDVDTVAFAQKLWALANPGKLSVFLVTVVPNPDYSSAAQRRLSAIAAITRDRRVKVETAVVRGKNWIQAIQPVRQANDLVICQAEQKMKLGFSKQQALSAGLVAAFHQPVFVIAGLYTEIKPIRSRWLAQVPYWIILFTIIAGFFIFEVGVDQSGSGWMEKTIFGLLFVLEVGLIWIWNSIMG